MYCLYKRMDCSGEGRCIGQIQTGHLLQCGSEGYCRHADIRHFVYRTGSQHLYTKQFMGSRIRHQLDSKPRTVRIVMGFVIGHCHDADRIISRRLRLFFRKTRSAARQTRKLHHAGSQHTRISHISAAQRKRQCTPFHIGRGTHGRPLPLTRKTVLHHRTVTRCIHIRHIGRHSVIHQNRSLKHLNPRILQKSCIGTDTDGKDHHIRGKQSFIGLYTFRSLLSRHAF